MKGGMCLKRFFLLFFSFYLFLTPSVYCSDLYLCPSGKAIGVKLHTDGLIVVDVCTITDENGIKCRINEFNKGDIILKVNNKKTENTESLKSIICKNTDTIDFTIKRHGKFKKITAKPIITDYGPSLGLWLRDSSAGIGTLTFIEPQSNTFGALGHGICDIDTSMLIPINCGSIINTNVTDVAKSSVGKIGELKCDFINTNIGKLKSNTNYGIFGDYEGESVALQKMKVASPEEITEGNATILTEIERNGIKQYDIEIKKINNNATNGRDMIIQITDDELLNKTGGIVQGMSGSPIIQNGKLVGAVTHVFVNDPTRGYGIFIENMLAEAEKIK